MDKPRPPRTAIIVHCGAWAIPSEEKEAHRQGALRAAETGWRVLEEFVQPPLLGDTFEVSPGLFSSIP